jgi:exodeoxyribonuclease III
MPRVITYNVNGIRSALSKGWMEWLLVSNADVVCLQEIKAHPEQIDTRIFDEAGYHHFWYPAEKKGYSGVAVLSRLQPTHVEYGCGMEMYDKEGRVLRLDFGDVSVMSVYMPSGSSGDDRQDFKMKWLDDFTGYINTLKQDRKKLIISGDYNICNKPIDIHNPVSNAKSSGFLPEERAWFDAFLETGFTDAFRHFNPHPHQYTWWSFRAGARNKNLGWRIDYNLVTDNLKPNLIHSYIDPEARHSDHCPCILDIEF